MVIWSYLLLGATAPASLEGVLAPVDPAQFEAQDEAEPAVAEDAGSRRPLVEVGADELDLLAELERQVGERLQPAGALRLVPVTPLPALPQGRPLPAVTILDQPARLTTSSALVRFILKDGERNLGTFAVSFRMQVLAQVWVPTRRLAPGEPLSPDDVVAREIDLAREPKAVPAQDDIFGQYEIARVVAPERPLAWSDLAPRALVRKGQLVEVVASQGLLSITMKGQATRSASRGEMVTIRNLESKREFSAEVVDENKVRVQF